ncbi:SGNH/GDSL hydrolase family protein [Lactiplantibacillus plantarum subsp. plantarum]|uniref:SGNH/GDSL hydrolase family protein n=1 Tax=Lactiplantibacillus plantarum TaxID=1590 RepID=UPI003EE79B79
MGVFEIEGTTLQGRDFRDHLNKNWTSGNQAFANLNSLYDINAAKKATFAPSGTLSTFDELKTQYPDGEVGIFVTADTGHWYYWNGSAWKDGGIYQSAGIADGSITADKIEDDSLGIEKINEVNLNDVHDSYLSINSATSWNGAGTINRAGRTITETSNGGDHGIVLQAHLNRIPTKDENIYLNLDYRMPDITNMTGAFEVYLMNKDGDIRKPGLISTDYTSIVKHARYSINGQFFINFNLDEKFKILFVVHGSGTLEVIDPLLNWTDRKISPFAQLDQLANDNSDGINDFSVSPAKVGQGNLTKMASVWGSGGIISYDSDELIFVQNSDGDSGCLIPIKIDASKPVYVNFDISVVGSIIEFYVLNDKNEINTAKGLEAADNTSMKRFNYTLEPQFFNELGVTTNCYLLFVVHKNNACFRLRNLSMSNTALVGNQQYFDNEIFSQLGDRKIERIGNPMLTDISNEPVNKIDKIHFGTPNSAVSIDNAQLDSISVSVPTAGTYTFQTAMIDQHQLIVAGKEFTVPLSAGYNIVNCRDKAIYLEKGSYLMMDLSGLGGLYPTSSTPSMSDALIQDETHMSDVVGYTGMIMYPFTGTLPFSYEVMEKPLTNQIVDINQNVETINTRLSKVNQPGNNLYVKDANGKTYRLFVDENGTLSVVSQTPNKVAIFGNSLIKEQGGIGMAASDSNHDWYHIITEYIKSKNKNVVINDRTNVSGWESATTSDARQAAFESLIKPSLDSDTDLVIIQLVDNVNTDDKKATFATDAQSLLSNIHTTSPKARILWVARWFGDDTLLAEVKTACSTQNATFVDITSIANQSGARSTLGATRTGTDGTSWQITSTGEAAHPSDLGMQLIAEKIEQYLEF